MFGLLDIHTSVKIHCHKRPRGMSREHYFSVLQKKRDIFQKGGKDTNMIKASNIIFQ